MVLDFVKFLKEVSFKEGMLIIMVYRRECLMIRKKISV